MSWVDQAKRWRGQLMDWWVPQPVVFHHVPKCGGTSVGRALRKRYLVSQTGISRGPVFQMAEALYGDASRDETWQRVCRFREEFLLYHMYCDTRCISAHVIFSERAHELFHQRYKFITVLREPVSRFISHYHYLKRRGHPVGSLQEFVQTEQARYIGARYVEYFCGSHQHDIYADASVERARENLNKFAAIGLMEDMSGFAAEIRQQVGVRIRIQHENQRTDGKTRSDDLPPELLNRIHELCAADTEIYRAAVQAREPTGADGV